MKSAKAEKSAKAPYLIHHANGLLIRVEQGAYVFIGWLTATDYVNRPGMQKIEIYEIARDGSERFLGYAPDGQFHRLCRPLINAVEKLRYGMPYEGIAR